MRGLLVAHAAARAQSSSIAREPPRFSGVLTYCAASTRSARQAFGRIVAPIGERRLGCHLIFRPCDRAGAHPLSRGARQHRRRNRCVGRRQFGERRGLRRGLRRGGGGWRRRVFGGCLRLLWFRGRLRLLVCRSRLRLFGFRRCGGRLFARGGLRRLCGRGGGWPRRGLRGGEAWKMRKENRGRQKAQRRPHLAQPSIQRRRRGRPASADAATRHVNLFASVAEGHARLARDEAGGRRNLQGSAQARKRGVELLPHLPA